MTGQTDVFTTPRLLEPLYLLVFSKPSCSLYLCYLDFPLLCHSPVPSGSSMLSTVSSLSPPDAPPHHFAPRFPAFRPPLSSNCCYIFSPSGQFQHTDIRLVTGPTGSYLQKHRGPGVPVVLGKKLLKESPRLHPRWTSCWLVKRSHVEELLGQPYLAYVL